MSTTTRTITFVALCQLVCSVTDAEPSSSDVPLAECGTRLTPGGVQRSLDVAREGAYRRSPERGGGPWQVRTAVHIVRTDAGLGGLTESQFSSALEKLNADFSPAGIVFAVVDPIDHIDSDAFYYDIDTLAEIDLLRATNVVSGALNLYFTGNMPFCGLSSFSWQSVQGVVLVNSCVVTPWNPSTFSHEVGHYFDLLHTHEVAYGAECVDGSNCASAGDLICDTPADPRLDRCGPGGNDYCVDASCAYTGTFVDGCNADPYEPSTDDFMSYSQPLCRDRFTPGQYARAMATLVNIRSDHILDAVFVPGDGGAPSRPHMLSGPFPNPAAGRVTFGIELPFAGFVDVRVFDVTGRHVASLVRENLSPGTYQPVWEPGSEVSSGAYFVTLSTGTSQETRRFVWMSSVRR